MHFSARCAGRRALAVGVGLAALACTASPAMAGQIVYDTEPQDGDSQIRVMNDDGSNDRLLVHEDDIPGAEAVYNPYVSPDGATVVFQARTPSPGGYGVFCGFRCSGIYAYEGGHVFRVSQAPTDCPPGDLCLGLDTDPRITGGGSHLFYEMVYGEPGGSYGTPQTISHNYVREITPGGGNEQELPKTSCDTRGDNVSPNPAVDGEYVTNTYCSGGSPWALKIMNVDGTEVQQIGYDDDKFHRPTFRGDGRMLVGAEDGGDPGIWLYDREGPSFQQLVSVTWDNDHRPFNANPTFVGDGKVAFIYGDSIRTVSTSCTSCSIGQTAELASRTEVDGIAWTSQNLPDPVVPATPGGGGGGGVAPAPAPVVAPKPAPRRGGTGGGGASGVTLKAPSTAKLAAALRSGIKVPFVATRTGKLTLKATISGALAKKLRIVKKRTSRPVVVASGSTTIRKAGDASVTLKFTGAAKKRLKKARSVPLALTGDLAGSALSGRTRLAK